MDIIKNVERVTAGLLSSEPASTHETSFVYKNTKGDYRLVENGAQLFRPEMRANRYSIRYSVARGSYTYRHQNEYPSKDPGKTFKITVQCSVTVSDPIQVVDHDIKNSKTYLDENISYWVEPLLQNYSIEDFREVQQVMKNLDESTSLIADLAQRGLKISQLQASVRLNNKDWAHFEKIEEMNKQQEIQKKKITEQQELEKMRLKEEQEVKRIRLQEEQELERIRLEKEKELSQLQAAIEKQKKEMELSYKEQEARLELKLQELQKEQWRKEQQEIEDALNEGGLTKALLKSAKDRSSTFDLLKEELQEKKDLQRRVIEEYIKKGDMRDGEVLTTVMDLLREEKQSGKQLTQSTSDEKRLPWGRGKTNEEKEPVKATVVEDEEWS